MAEGVNLNSKGIVNNLLTILLKNIRSLEY